MLWQQEVVVAVVDVDVVAVAVAVATDPTSENAKRQNSKPFLFAQLNICKASRQVLSL